MLALDFDGVVADGLHECLLVAWNVFHDLPLASFDQRTLEAIPSDFVERFRYLRNFVRHDGHFLVPFRPGAQVIRTQADFDVTYRAVSPTEQASFQERFVAYRGEARAAKIDYWMDLHVIHDSLVSIIAGRSDTRIVSGKDAESIDALLRFKNIVIASERIFGRMTNKVEVLGQLQREANGELLFCDDNIWNVIEARTLGIETIWALWGYHTLDHLDEAKARGIPGYSLNAFVDHLTAIAA